MRSSESTCQYPNAHTSEGLREPRHLQPSLLDTSIDDLHSHAFLLIKERGGLRLMGRVKTFGICEMPRRGVIKAVFR